MIDKELLKETIRNKGLKLYWIADKMEIPLYSLSRRISGDTEFKPSEINKLREVLELSDEQFMDIFFSNHVG